MELRTWIKVLCLIQILQDFLECRVNSMPSTVDCRDSRKYDVTSGGKTWCCLKCQAGQMVKRDCLEGQPMTTKCEDCKEGYGYQPKPNGKKYCKRCNRELAGNRELLLNCTKFHNQRYGDCRKGFFHNRNLVSCMPCTRCAVGTGVIRECRKFNNTICSKKCPLSTFSDKESFTQKCKPCTRCDGDREVMIKGCTESHDFVCQIKVPGTISTAMLSTVAVTETPTVLGSSDLVPPTARSSSGQNWVMPFFISAMVMLLVLFLAFVIIVTIWCHRQSRKNESRTIVEDPRIEQRLNVNRFEEAQSVLLLKEVPKEERYHSVDIPAKKLKENGMMIRDLTHDIVEELSNYLNPTNTPNSWKKVASQLGFSWAIINNLSLHPTRATQELLVRWGTKKESTIFTLYKVLKKIGRDDAADILERVLTEPSPNFPKSV